MRKKIAIMAGYLPVGNRVMSRGSCMRIMRHAKRRVHYACQFRMRGRSLRRRGRAQAGALFACFTK